MYMVLVLVAGLFQAAMGSLNGLLGNYIGPFSVSFMAHAVGILPLGLYILLVEKHPIRFGFGKIPFYVYSAGFLGATITAIGSYCVARLGAAVVVCISAAAQLVLSAAVDHFGWFGAERVPFDRRRLPAILVILAGIVLINMG